ncbi:MAG: DUF2470 domain-containing protein [Pseudomonadota bacterium]
MNVTPAEMQRIVNHMNEDHADALVLYAHAYAARPDVTEATMLGLTPTTIELGLSGDTRLSVPLTRPIDTAHEAHRVLVDMAIEGRKTVADAAPLAAGGVESS